MAVTFRPTRRVTDEEILALSRANPGHRFERTAEGKLVVAPPVGLAGSRGEGELFRQLANWNTRTRLGMALPSSAGFRLPNTALRGPDASWLSNERASGLTEHEREGFPHVCPDGAFELRSRSDRRATLVNKMAEYLANGARIAVLIDPRRRTVEIHRPGSEPETLVNPSVVSFDPELPGFELELEPIFDPA